ncbi:MAG: 5'-nucleotidase, partial [Hydrogenophaga sp.]|nr:5'-nucleotidase [Hydrogenophaga sp.]
MAATLDGQLVVAISSRALFDFEEENRVFEDGMVQPPVPGAKKDAAYMQLQLDRLDVPAKPGVAFSLVKKLLAFNEAPENPAPTLVASRTALPPEGALRLRPGEAGSAALAGKEAAPPRDGPAAKLAQRVEVVILSRNDPVSGMRVFRSAQHYGLPIQRGVFTRGSSPWRYLKPLHANLFLSANDADVRSALEAGVPAARVLPHAARASEAHPNEVRIAFDGDAVLFSDEAEQVFQSGGLDAFQRHEADRAASPLAAGPFKPLLHALQQLQQASTERMRLR